MKKFINIFLAVLITLFSFPIGNVNVSAAEKVYDDIADGEYQIGVSSSNDSANGFLTDEATLIVKDEKLKLIVSYKVKGFDLNWTKLEGKNPLEEAEKDDEKHFTFEIEKLKSKYSKSMEYADPDMPGPVGTGHEVEYDLILNEQQLNDLPIKEEPKPEETEEPGQPEETEKPEDENLKPEPAPEERVVGELISEADADEVYTVNFDSDSKATKGQLENPTKLLVKGDKEYIQISVNDRGAPLFRSLKFNGEEVTWNSITEGPYTIQYELVDGIEGNIDVSMVIQAGPNAMPHDGIKLWFDKDSLEVVKEAEKPKEEPEEKPDALKVFEINYEVKHETEDKNSSANAFFKKPGYILEKNGETYFQAYVTSWQMIDSLKYEDKDKDKDVEVVSVESNSQGERALVQMKIDSDLGKEIALNMHITVPGMYSAGHDARLVFDKNTKKEVNPKGFSIYGLEGDSGQGGQGGTPPNPTPGNPTPEPTPTPEPKPRKGKVNLTPDKAYEINYTILQENGKDVSVADDFFVKPGKLLVKDGKTYLQMTVGSADMVKSLSNKYGDYIIVSNNKDGSMTMQIRVPNDLSDIALDMHIVVPAGAVPGFPGYDSKHGAILTFDLASKKEIPVEGLEVVASGDKDNENGPYVEGATPGKPAFGDNDNENGDKKFGKNGNPKTGDTSQIFFFASLLMASLAVLVLQLRRRLAA